MDKIRIHKESKIKKHINRNDKFYKVLRFVYAILMYGSAIYVLEYHFDLSLFLKAAILYGIIKGLEKL